MNVQRISVKFFSNDPSALGLDSLIPVFHGWIQRQVTDELLIDVADYKHVHHGPGIVLVGHEGDYALDLAGGRTGLRYTRKHIAFTPLEPALATALERALAGCGRIETDRLLRGSLTFGRGELEVQIQDRLRLPNTDEGRAEAVAAVSRLLEAWYPDSTLSVTPAQTDARRPVQLNVYVRGGPDLSAPQIPLAQVIEA